MKKIITSMFILPALLLTPHLLRAEETPTICTLEYAPVCGEVDNGIRCVTTPCPSTDLKTFGNECQLNAEKATLLYEGECQEQEPNLEEVLSEESQEIQDLLDQITEVEDTIDALSQEIEAPVEQELSWFTRTWSKLTDWIIFWK